MVADGNHIGGISTMFYGETNRNRIRLYTINCTTKCHGHMELVLSCCSFSCTVDTL